MNNDLSLVLWLHTLKLNLSHISILERYQEGTGHLIGKHKLINDLVGLGYLWEGEITPKGLELMEQVNSWDGVWVPKQDLKVEKPKLEYAPEFLEWYKTFPASDSFTIGDKTFVGTRNLRTGKDKCHTKYMLLIKEIPHQELLDALEFEVSARKDQSLKRGHNELSFMTSTSTYLEQRRFELFLPLSRKGKYISQAQESNKVKINTTAY